VKRFILGLLIVPLVVSLAYLATHPMPSHDLKSLEQALEGTQQTAEAQAEEDWRLHVFDKAPQAGDPGIPAGKHIRIETDLGSFTIELFPEEAPNTVANFKALAARGFYDGLTFHRVIPGFVAQGGDPKGNGTGGPGYHIRAEFNSHRHVTGTVAMARGPDPDSAGSQFYICYGAHPHLDGHYTVFGQVIKGQEVVDRITRGTVMRKVRGLP